MHTMVDFTRLELLVIDELKEVYDPIIMNEQEQWIEFNRIANHNGIEADEVKIICDKWVQSQIDREMKELEAQRIENQKLREWEEKFDLEQKQKEEEERLRDEKLIRRERERALRFQNKENNELDDKISKRLENFEIKQTRKN